MNKTGQEISTGYRNYPAYKPSDIDWIGDIPQSWDIKQLRYAAQIVMGQSPISEDYENDEIGMPFLQGNAEFTDRHPIPKLWCQTANKHCKDGDILLSVRAPVGAINLADREYGIGRGLCAVRGTAFLQPFLTYMLHASAEHLNVLSSGSTFTAISVDDVKSLALPLPTTKEQEAIANFLDRKTALIDEVIAKKQKLIELLKEKRQALITQAVTKGLDPNAKLKPSGIEWLGDIPEGWEVKRLKRLGRPIIGLTYSPEDVTMADHGTLVLRASNVQAGRIVYEDNVYVSVNIPKELQTRVGDILICSRSGSANLIGKNAIIDNQSAGMTFGAFMTIFRSAHNAFLYFFFNSPLFESQSGLYATTTINQLTTSMLSNFMLAVPPVREQGRIVDFLIRETSQIDSVVTKIIDQIDKLHEYRLALITSAVTGKIDVRGQ